MLGKIMAHEWRIMARDRGIIVVLAIYLGLLVYGTVNGADRRDELAERTAAATALADNNLSARLDILDSMLANDRPYRFQDDPRVAGTYARVLGFEMATKSPPDAGLISTGQTDVAPSYLRVQWKPMFKQNNIEEIANPLLLETGMFDLAFVIVYIYPLLIIAISYNMLSAERESGTQAMLMSQPVGIWSFLMGKVLIRGLLVIGLGASVTSTAILLVHPNIIIDREIWRIAILVAIISAYGAVWFSASLLVSSLGWRSVTNALVLSIAWVTFVLIVPSIVNLAANAFYPLPSRIEMVQALREGDARAKSEMKSGKIYDDTLARMAEEEAVQIGTIELQRRLLPMEQRAEEIAAPIFNRFENQRKRQRNMNRRLLALSPATLTQSALNRLAESDAGSFARFNEQVIQYQQQWRAYFLPAALTGRYLSREELEATPRFVYRPETASAILQPILNSLAKMLIMLVILCWLGWVALKRYEIGRR